MRYRLRTLMVLSGAVPPMIAFVWFSWWKILLVALFIAAIALWIIVSLALARLFAGLICSVMR